MIRPGAYAPPPEFLSFPLPVFAPPRLRVETTRENDRYSSPLPTRTQGQKTVARPTVGVE